MKRYSVESTGPMAGPMAGYWGPLAHLVEYANDAPTRPNPQRPELHLTASYNLRTGQCRRVRVQVRPDCRLKHILTQPLVQRSGLSTTQGLEPALPKDPEALREPTHEERRGTCGADRANHLSEVALRLPTLWRIHNHLEERLLDQAQARASYTPLFWSHSRSIPQGMILDVQPLVKSLFCPIRPSPNGFFDFEASTP